MVSYYSKFGTDRIEILITVDLREISKRHYLRELRIREIDFGNARLPLASKFRCTGLQDARRNFSARRKHQPACVHMGGSGRNTNVVLRAVVLFPNFAKM